MAGRTSTARAIGLVATMVLVTTGCAWITRSSVPNRPVPTAGAALGGISGSGRYVTFSAAPREYVDAGLTTFAWQALVRDNITGTTTIASLSPTGDVADADAFAVDISENGRYVAYTSSAS